jgi:hypothetical protein
MDDWTIDLMLGDCLDMLKELDDNSVDSIVTDPPYGLSKEPDMTEVLRHWLAGDDYVHKGKGFMGKSWDSFVPGPSIWRECLRVLKPGGHLLAFFGTRTHDMGTLAIRLAGFEVRDTVMWVYGSGFPKSMDVSKAIDKAAGVERLVVSRRAAAVGFDTARQGGGGWSAGEVVATAPASDPRPPMGRLGHRAQARRGTDHRRPQASDRDRGRERAGARHGGAEYRRVSCAD